MDARRIVVKYDTMISCAVDNVPTSSLRSWRGVRCGARRLHVAAGRAGMIYSGGRIVLFFASMISSINGVPAKCTDIWTDFPWRLESRALCRSTLGTRCYPRLKTAAAVDRESFDSGLSRIRSDENVRGDATCIGSRADIIHQSSTCTQRRNVLCTQRFGPGWF